MPSKQSTALGTIAVIAVPLTLFVVLTAMHDISIYWRSRFLFLPGKHVGVAIVAWAITLTPYAWLIWRACLRKTDGHTWIEGFGSKLSFALVLFSLFFCIGSSVEDAAIGILDITASTPSTFTATVTDAGSSMPRRANRQLVAMVHTTDGRDLRLLDFDDIYTNHIHDVMLVNGNCELAKLHKGDKVTVNGRISTYGFVVDSITTASCKPRQP